MLKTFHIVYFVHLEQCEQNKQWNRICLYNLKDSVLVIPEESYSPELLHPNALDMASDFINQCGAQGFHIEYVCTFVCLFVCFFTSWEHSNNVSVSILQPWLWFPLLSFLSLHSASEFCKSSARSLVAHYLDGALPCHCHKVGATSPTCEPIGGQCHCRPHVIGRQCSRCATGFFGFPYCRRECPLLDTVHTAFTLSANFTLFSLFFIGLI